MEKEQLPGKAARGGPLGPEASSSLMLRPWAGQACQGTLHEDASHRLGERCLGKTVLQGQGLRCGAPPWLEDCKWGLSQQPWVLRRFTLGVE